MEKRGGEEGRRRGDERRRGEEDVKRRRGDKEGRSQIGELVLAMRVPEIPAEGRVSG